MKLKKFEEYTLDIDSGEIAQEYCKLIISTYLDKKNDETLESVYAKIIIGDEIEEGNAYIIKNEMQDYLYNLYEEAKKIRKIIEIEKDKFNI